MKYKRIGSLFLLFAISACGNVNDSSNSKTSSSFSSISTSTVNGSSSSSLSTTTTSSSSSSSTFIDEEKPKILEAIKLGVENDDKVVSGVFTHKTSSTLVTNYEFGTDNYGKFSHLSFDDYDEYYGYNALNEKYGLKVENRKLSKINIDQTEEFVNGPEVKPYSEVLYGASGYMQYMYDMIVSNSNNDYLSLTMDGGYKFSVGKVTSAGTKNYVWVNTVQFVLEDNAFKTISTTLEKYSNVAMNYANNTYYINPGAKPVATYYITFEQVIGERNATNPYDIETYYYDSLDLVDSSGNILGDKLNMLAGENPEFTLSNVTPSTANIIVDPIEFKLIKGEDNIKGNYNSSSKKYTISCDIPGEYTIELSTHYLTKTIDVVVGDPVPEVMNIKYYIYTDGYYNTNLIEANNEIISSYVNCEIFFAPYISPDLADQSHELLVTSDNKDYLNIDTTIINTSSHGVKNVEVYRFVASKIGTYDICFKSKVDENVSLSFKFEVKEAPTLESLLETRYADVAGGELIVDIKFTPSSDDINKGKVYIYDLYGENSVTPIEDTYDYEYDTNSKSFDLVKEDGTLIEDGLSFDSLYKLVYKRVCSNIQITMSVFSHRLMLTNAEWQAPTDIPAEFYIFSFDSNTNTGKFRYYRSENFVPVEEFECKISYTIEEIEEGYSIKLSDTSIENMKGFRKITDVISITVSSNFRTFVSVLEIEGVETTLTHHRSRG